MGLVSHAMNDARKIIEAPTGAFRREVVARSEKLCNVRRPAMPPPALQFSLRPATAVDVSFCFTLYASTRAEEMAATGWPAAQREAFLRQQFAARTESYRATFPDATHSIIVVERKPVGALIVHRTSAEIRLVDIAVIAARRGTGLGGRVLQTLIDDARGAGLPLRLQVLKNNRAQQLYLRLGFTPTGANGLYLKLEWRGHSASAGV